MDGMLFKNGLDMLDCLVHSFKEVAIRRGKLARGKDEKRRQAQTTLAERRKLTLHSRTQVNPVLANLHSSTPFSTPPSIPARRSRRLIRRDHGPLPSRASAQVSIPHFLFESNTLNMYA